MIFPYDSVNEKIYAVPTSSSVAHVLSVRQSSDVVSINFDISQNISETLALSDSASTNKSILQKIFQNH